MSLIRAIKDKPNILALAVAVLLILFPLGFSLFSFVFAGSPDPARPFLEIPGSAGKDCVRDTEYMRFHHWELLREIRDRAVRDRQRGELSLSKCRECHQSREQFCNRCHDAVNLKPDCWGCHYYPDSPEASSGDGHVLQSELKPEPPTITMD
jgi:hypothetical protein